jgi:AAA domain
MSSDADVGKILAAAEASGAKLVAVGDYRQLGSVGPGGALEALVSRHPDHVWALTDNLRQVDPGNGTLWTNSAPAIYRARSTGTRPTVGYTPLPPGNRPCTNGEGVGVRRGRRP